MIRNRSALAGTPARELALACVEAGIEAANPRRVVREAVHLDGETLTVAGESLDLDEYEEVVVLGGGKAADGVASALEAVLGDRIDRGVVVTDDVTADLRRVDVRTASHPVPDECGVRAASEVLELADEAGEETLVLAVVTGGGSALLPAPAGDLSLPDLQATTESLLASGATIAEVNAVRKHLSALKGGRLAERAAPARVVGLVLSDVVGDDLGTIASGPLSPDESTFADASGVLDRYGIDAPDAVLERLVQGEREEVPETPKPGNPAFERVSVHVLASGATAIDAAAEVASERGYEPLVLSSRVRGEAREAAKTHAAIAEEVLATGNPLEAPAVVLSGGETTVTVRGDGEGGPNLEFALSWALDVDIDLGAEAALASVDTDGRDGGTDVAGALVNSETVGGRVGTASERVGTASGLIGTANGQIDEEEAREALADNDSLGVLDGAECTIRTGPTGTNVNDLRVLVVEDRIAVETDDGVAVEVEEDAGSGSNGRT